MWLAARLYGIRAVGAKCIPEDKRVIVGAACKELVDFGVMNGVIKVGDSLPPHMDRRPTRALRAELRRQQRDDPRRDLLQRAPSMRWRASPSNAWLNETKTAGATTTISIPTKSALLG